MQEVLEQLDIIECFEQPGRKRHISEVTKKQMDLYKELGVDVPN